MNPLAILVEFLGTFLFLSVIVATSNPWIIGGALAVLMALSGSVSGGYFNPAVTITSFYNHTIAIDTAVAYIAVQIAGGLLAITVYNQMKNR